MSQAAPLSLRRLAERPQVERLALAGLSAAAGAIHLLVVREHLQEYALFGAFFLVSGLAQLAWAAMALGPRGSGFYLAGNLGNAAIVALWIASRSLGLPIGPEHWTPEILAFHDVLCTVFEVALAIGCGVMLRTVPMEPVS
ncbi:MAG: hypothetical protein HY240_07065 [Actinobacteria bacterium]|nr:hypothetical protein [Actinomycetota bacterium]